MFYSVFCKNYANYAIKENKNNFLYNNELFYRIANGSTKRILMYDKSYRLLSIFTIPAAFYVSPKQVPTLRAVSIRG
jgi:hypothetical protein